MKPAQQILLAAALLFAVPCLFAQVSEADIVSQIKTLRSLDGVQRPLTTIKLAQQVRAFPAGLSKVKLADALANLVTEGDQGQDALQTAADTSQRRSLSSPSPPRVKNRPSRIFCWQTSFATSRSPPPSTIRSLSRLPRSWLTTRPTYKRPTSPSRICTVKRSRSPIYAEKS